MPMNVQLPPDPGFATTTATELLARLPDRPTAQPGQLATANARLRHARDRAEFDRDLLLDAVEFSRRCTEQACAENSMCAMRCSADHVLDTIVTELRSNP